MLFKCVVKCTYEYNHNINSIINDNITVLKTLIIKSLIILQC